MEQALYEEAERTNPHLKECMADTVAEETTATSQPPRERLRMQNFQILELKTETDWKVHGQNVQHRGLCRESCTEKGQRLIELWILFEKKCLGLESVPGLCFVNLKTFYRRVVVFFFPLFSLRNLACERARQDPFERLRLPSLRHLLHAFCASARCWNTVLVSVAREGRWCWGESGSRLFCTLGSHNCRLLHFAYFSGRDSASEQWVAPDPPRPRRSLGTVGRGARRPGGRGAGRAGRGGGGGLARRSFPCPGDLGWVVRPARCSGFPGLAHAVVRPGFRAGGAPSRPAAGRCWPTGPACTESRRPGPSRVPAEAAGRGAAALSSRWAPL
ncbi:PREDICTED: uncharacterized protein LOC106148183 [Chinchilla lanigera]|uniref:uncharacterized protein LOC106148183 n=1 Tax=Chinchilla lanigera TaxID=34839 RepID=UPI0006986F2D|nr:PREDICTED: uncharacterized protein LOC106148183 [Chinchilla lanigera]